jgi:hypothetical protein
MSIRGSDHLSWWKEKLSRMADRTFVRPEYGCRILDVLMASKERSVRASSLKELGAQLGVPLKFVPRAVASATRLGIVSAHLKPPHIFVTIHPDRFARRKIRLNVSRRPISPADQKSLKVQSDYRCACCGKRFAPSQLVIDHLIPLGLLGADALENWVVMSKKHNGMKWDRFLRDTLKLYRKERVMQPFGVRFINGSFWPVINGKVRCSRLQRRMEHYAVTHVHGNHR